MLDLSPLWISLRIAAIATPITVFLGIIAAYLMHHYQGRWRSLLDSLFLAPMVLPPTVLGFLLLLLLGKNGPLGTLMESLGINVIFTWYAAIITATVVSFPLMYKTVLGALAQIDDHLLQAARTLGATELMVFWCITLPLALPGILAGTTLSFARALGEFGATLMLAGNIPGQTQTIPMAIFFAVEAGAFKEAAIWSGVILMISLGGLLVMNGWQRGVTRKTVRRKRWMKRFYPRLLRFPLKKWHLRLPTTIFTNRTLPRFTTATSTHAAANLTVTLIKHLPGFTLNVAFSTYRQPLGLLGASGAGKSLILRCIAGIETPDKGRIVLNGRVLFDSELGINVPSCDRRVGILFQNYALFPHLTVAQNIAFGLPPHLSVQQQRQIVDLQLATVQLQGLGDYYPAVLSGGQQQRVAIARVLASQPEVMLLDEPFCSLDTHLRYQIERDLQLWLENFSGITLLVTHNIEEAYRICQNLLVMDRGTVSVHNSKHEVLEYPNTVNTARLTGCKNISRAVPVDPSTIYALDWNCTLKMAEPIAAPFTHIGMRAHKLGFLEAISQKESTVCQEDPQRSLWISGHIDDDEQRIQESQKENKQQFLPYEQQRMANTFLCWLTMTSETPHRMTLYLKLHEPPAHLHDYHLQAEVFKEKWVVLKEMPLPWSIVLPSERLMLLEDCAR